MENKEIILGACDIYMYEFTGETIPSHEEIETSEHNVGDCSGGFAIDYKPTKYDVENQHGAIVKSFITKEEISAKTGIMTWNLGRLALLSTAEFEVDDEKNIKTLTFTGNGKALKTVLLRAVHKKENGKKIRFTMLGQGGSGFALTFENKELTVDAELAAVKVLDGFLASFEEEIEAPASSSSQQQSEAPVEDTV